jgi:hypothetical protein
MATIASDHDRSVSVGRVLSRAFETIGANPLATLGIAFLFNALPITLVGYAVQNWQMDSVLRLDRTAAIALALLSFVIAILLAMITQGALVRATVAHSEGRRSGFGESAMAGLVVAVPLFLLGLLGAIGVALGFVLLIVPGVMLYVMWSVAAPALVEERLGPIEAFGRSRFLTRGARWKIFGLILVVLVIGWLISAVAEWGSAAYYGGMTRMAAEMRNGIPISYLAVSFVAQTLASVISGVAMASLYVELRDWKDGPAADKLAEVFA